MGKKYFGQFSQKQMELSVSYGLWKLNELRSETRVFPTFYCNFLIIKYIQESYLLLITDHILPFPVVFKIQKTKIIYDEEFN